jgi:hypothetical protein
MEQQLEEKLSDLKLKLKQFKIRRGLNAIDQETYELTSEHLHSEIQQICKEINRRFLKYLT